jgi:hypothetical protein
MKIDSKKNPHLLIEQKTWVFKKIVGCLLYFEVYKKTDCPMFIFSMLLLSKLPPFFKT